MSFNLLTDKLIRTLPLGKLTLPGLLAAYARDDVDSLVAIRPHQDPALHMFVTQLGAMAMRRAGLIDIPEDEEIWADLLRAMTSSFAGDEPWHLIVDDWAKPAFMQPPVPDDVRLSSHVSAPDALDILITSRNHEIKQATARQGMPDDWLLALITLQTMEGYGGAGNQGIARMNGGYSSRPLLTIAPLPAGAKMMTPRPGARFRRDVAVLLETYEREMERVGHFADEGGIALTWIEPWNEGDQLQLGELDIWAIEVCRRVRLVEKGDVIAGWRGTSKATRIDAKHLKGSLGDPFAPVHKTKSEGFSLSRRDFDYRTLMDLVLSGNWILPVLAKPGTRDGNAQTMTLIAQAVSREQGKTAGFKFRILPMSGKISRAIGPRREALHELAKAQAEVVANFSKAIGNNLALVVARGESEKRKQDDYKYARKAQKQLTHLVDEIFFEHLWSRLEAHDLGPEALDGEALRWARTINDCARRVFEAALPTIPCPSLIRPRAEARALRGFNRAIRRQFPDLFEGAERELESES